ncbi:MAG: hypothetical protein ABSG65_25515 [Bryobacteraceae bacterium]|jgi:hypothetical protein
MIIVSTDYDRLTSVLAEFADELENYGGAVQVLKKASSGDLEKILGSSKSSVIFFGHGKINPPSLLDQSESALWGSHAESLLEERVLYANACHSLEALAGLGVARIGFSGKLEVYDDQAYFAAQRDCILAGPRALLAGKTVREAADESKQAFRGRQRELFRGTFGESVIAIRIFKANADRLAFTGDETARGRS